MYTPLFLILYHYLCRLNAVHKTGITGRAVRGLMLVSGRINPVMNKENVLCPGSAGICTVFVQQVPEESVSFGLTHTVFSPPGKSSFSQRSCSMDSRKNLPSRLNDVKFRVLIIGRANAGKTSILQRVCNTTKDPEIYSVDSSGARSPVRSHPLWPFPSHSLTRFNNSILVRR